LRFFRRHVLKGEIDFTFITGRIGVMAIPVEGVEFAYNRKNRAEQVAKFLAHHYGERYLIFNVASEFKTFSSDKFGFRVREFPITSLSGRIVSLSSLYSVCEAVYEFLVANQRMNVVVTCPVSPRPDAVNRA
jgi:hypothetical protein